MRSTSALVVALLLATALPAHAQIFTKADSVLAALTAHADATPTWHLGIGGGMSMPLTDAKTALENGFNGQVYLAWLPRSPLGIRLTANVDRHVLREPTVGQEPPATGTLIGGFGGITIGASAGTVRPYLTLGAGAFDILIERNNVRTQTIKFGVDAGAGLRLHVGSVAVFCEGRLQNMFNPPRVVPESPRPLQQMEAQIVPITFGLQF